MNEVVVLRGAEPRKILKTAIEKGLPAIMSYLSKGKWHVAKVLLTDLGANMLNIEVSPRKRGPILQRDCKMRTQKLHPINIRVNQPVGISLKYGYGKFIFDTTVVGLESSSDPTNGGTIVLALPDRIEIVQRRSYFRVDVPESLKVNVLLWHRRRKLPVVDFQISIENSQSSIVNRLVRAEPAGARQSCWQGKLIDISAGGAQIAVDTAQKPDFKKGQFIGLRFTPMPYETPLMFNAQIRSILPTADGKSICLGLQIVGLEASSEGRGVLRRLCSVVERYYRINESSAKQQDLQTGSHFVPHQLSSGSRLIGAR